MSRRLSRRGVLRGLSIFIFFGIGFALDADVGRYVKLERVNTANRTPGWRWCLAPECGAGQVHVSVVMEVEDGDDETPEQSERASSSSSSEVHASGSWSQDGAEWTRRDHLSEEEIQRYV